METSGKKKMRFLWFAVLLLFVSACTKELGFVDSTILKPGKVRLIERGSTTKEQIIKGFGKPESDTLISGGKESFFYKDLNLRSLWIEFGEDGIVSDFRFSGK